ncbi:MAG: L-2-amino-thiazoline-4-carboxylic acid hydrolase [Pirellulales bacterium]
MRLKFGSLGASFWARGFLRKLRREVRAAVVAGAPLNVAAIETAARRDAQALFDAERPKLPDKQARSITAMCSLVLGAYRALCQHGCQSEAAFEIVRRAFAQTYPAPVTWLVRVWLWWHRDPMAALERRSFTALGARMYGQSMSFADEKSPDRVAFLVTRCAFHQYFQDHGAPQLTPLICAWDRHWMDAIDRSSRPLRTERPSTISTGGECCRFNFVRDPDKSGTAKNDIVLVQLQTR